MCSHACVCAGTEEDKDAGYSTLCLKRWCWCDALFMAPPTWIALASASGDTKYLEFSEAEFWATHEYLYRPLPDLAPSAGLFLCDSRCAWHSLLHIGPRTRSLKPCCIRPLLPQ